MTLCCACIYACVYHAVFLTTEDIKVVVDMTWEYRTRWRFIGIELGIDTGTLETIQKSNRTVKGCLHDVVKHWLFCELKPTQDAVTMVLQSKLVSSMVLPGNSLF